MSTFYFTTPVSDEDIRKVHIGDVIYLTGDITTGRDDVHIRVVKGGKESPVDLKGKAIFHAGPIMKKISKEGEPDKYKVISVGPTECVDVDGVEWLDLGMPEAMWKLKTEKFGPLIVSIDSYGNNLIENNKITFREKKEAALDNLKGKLDFMH